MLQRPSSRRWRWRPSSSTTSRSRYFQPFLRKNKDSSGGWVGGCIDDVLAQSNFSSFGPHAAVQYFVSCCGNPDHCGGRGTSCIGIASPPCSLHRSPLHHARPPFPPFSLHHHHHHHHHHRTNHLTPTNSTLFPLPSLSFHQAGARAGRRTCSSSSPWTAASSPRRPCPTSAATARSPPGK